MTPSVGQVGAQKIHFAPPLVLPNGNTLANYGLIIEIYGVLNTKHSNAVLVCPALNASHHKLDLTRANLGHALIQSVGGITWLDQANLLVRGVGADIDKTHAFDCVQKGINVIQQKTGGTDLFY